MVAMEVYTKNGWRYHFRLCDWYELSSSLKPFSTISHLFRSYHQNFQEDLSGEEVLGKTLEATSPPPMWRLEATQGKINYCNLAKFNETELLRIYALTKITSFIINSIKTERSKMIISHQKTWLYIIYATVGIWRCCNKWLNKLIQMRKQVHIACCCFQLNYPPHRWQVD